MSNKVSIMQEMFKKEGSDELVPAVTIIQMVKLEISLMP